MKSKFLSVLISNVLLANFGIVNAEKVYITGNGIATRLHEPILKRISNVEIESIVIPEEMSTTDNIVVSPNDWLFLGTPVYKHKQHIFCCAEKYKKILCEKPVGLSISEINQIKNLINQNQILFRVNYALRFLPCLENVKEFIQNNNNMDRVTITCNANFNQNPPNRAWKNDYKLGGGIVYSILPHMVDLLNYLNFSAELASVSCKSTTQIPMNDMKLCSKTSSGIDTVININLCENFDELTLKIETPDQIKIFDLIDSSENKVFDTKYHNGTLSATSEISPWRISFKYLLETLFVNPDDFRLAKIEDAENVHKIIDILL